MTCLTYGGLYVQRLRGLLDVTTITCLNMFSLFMSHNFTRPSSSSNRTKKPMHHYFDYLLYLDILLSFVKYF